MSDRFWYALRKSRFSASTSRLSGVSGGVAQDGLSVGPGRAMRRDRFAHDGAGVQYATLPGPKSSLAYRGGSPEGIMVSKKNLTGEVIDWFAYLPGRYASLSFTAIGIVTVTS